MTETTDLNLGREALFSLSARGVMAIFGFIGVVVFLRVLGPDKVGVYYFILAVVAVVGRIPAGVAEAIRKRISEVQNDPEEFLGLGLSFYLGYCAIVALIVIAVNPLLLEFTVYGVYSQEFIFLLFSIALFNTANHVHAALGNPSTAVWFDTVRSVLTLGSQLLLLYLGFEIQGLMIGLIAGSFVTAIGVLLYSGVRPALPSQTVYDSTFQFAKWSVPNGLVSNIYSRVDVLMLGALVGSGSVGVYTAANRLTLPATMLAESISGPLNVKSSGLSSVGKEVQQDLENSLAYTGLFAFPMVFGALALGDALMVTIYGPDLTDTGHVILAMALFQVLFVFRFPFDAVINGINRPRLVFLVSSTTVAINVVAAILLAPTFGIIGVIGATILAEAIRFVLFQALSRQIFGTFLLPHQVFKQAISGAVMYGVIIGLGTIFSPYGWLSLIVTIGIGALVYFIMLYVASSHFRETSNSIYFALTKQS